MENSKPTFFMSCIPDHSSFSYLMAIYSFIPVFFLFFLIVKTFHQRKMEKLLIAYLVILALNELFLKNLLAQARPENACDESYGMPSGHSIVSTCFGTFYILQSTFQSFLSPLHRIIRSILHLILWVPIPYSRIYLNYHSVSQVIVGCIMGLFIGIAIGIWILPNFYEYYISSPLSPSFFLSRKKKIQNL